MSLPMRVGLGQFNELTDEKLTFIKQMGCDDFLMNTPRLPGDKQWEYEDLAAYKARADAADLRLMALENVPTPFYDKIMLGQDGRQEQLQHMINTVRNMGKAGIPILGYYFSLAGVSGHWRAYGSGGGRGDAGLKSFDYDLVKDAPPIVAEPVSVEEMWARMAYFLERVVPVAENAGVKLAAHQDDPPAESLFGTGRLLTNHDAMQRLIDLVPSECNGLEFCQGTVAEMGPEKTIGAVSRFAGQGKIFYVHFRNVSGSVPEFSESFIDDGYVDMARAMRLYRQAGVDVPMIEDHVPHLSDDDEHPHRSRAFAIGYIKALLDSSAGEAS